jgi:hypothetical protein
VILSGPSPEWSRHFSAAEARESAKRRNPTTVKGTRVRLEEKGFERGLRGNLLESSAMVQSVACLLQ